MNCRGVLPVVLALSGLFSNHSVASPTAAKTTVLGPFTEHYAELHPAKIRPHTIRYYGTDLGCIYVTSTGRRAEDDYGWLYAANIIEQWVRPASDGVDVIWNASTSNPYRVILLKTGTSP